MMPQIIFCITPSSVCSQLTQNYHQQARFSEPQISVGIFHAYIFFSETFRRSFSVVIVMMLSGNQNSCQIIILGEAQFTIQIKRTPLLLINKQMIAPYFANYNLYNPFYPGFYNPFFPFYDQPNFSPSLLPSSQTTTIKQEAELTEQQGPSATVREAENASQHSSQKTSKYRYAKKNVESNIVNQVISYISTKSKSRKLLFKLFKSNLKVDAFYQILKHAKKGNKGYIGRSYLQNMLEADEEHPIFILQKKLRHKNNLKLSDMRKALRVLTNHFLRNIIVPALLTSSKLDKATVKQHLLRAREIYYFVNNLSSPYGLN